MPPERSSGFEVLGVHVDSVQIPDVIRQMRRWIDERSGCRWIAVTGMHGIMVALDDPEFRAVIRRADLVVPDGMSLVMLGRLRGHRLHQRVYGPDLFASFLADPAANGTRHFFYGGGPGVADAVADAVRSRYARVQVVGTLTPPFRPLTPEEDDAVVQQINAVAPDVVWVGLSTPKQETWMHQHSLKLRASVLVGIGAAFDFVSGRVRQAPSWVRNGGFEWLWRLSQEPGRLWRRTVLLGPRFVFRSLAELVSQSLRQLWKR